MLSARVADPSVARTGAAGARLRRKLSAVARPAARSRARGSTPAASCVHAAESDSQLGHAAPWHTAARQRAAALLAGVSLLASAPVSPFPATADAAGRSTIQFQQTVNARRLLREALPIDLSKSPLAEAEDLLESIADTLPRSAATSRSITGADLKETALERAKADAVPPLRKALSVLNGKREQILSLVQPENRAAGEKELEDVCAEIASLIKRLEGPTPPDIREVARVQERALLAILDLETECVPAALAGGAAPLPAGFENSPVLRGRAVVEIDLKLRKAGLPDGGKATMRMVVDGFNAPLSAGNFVDLAAAGAYDGTKVGRADGFVVQLGDSVRPPRKVPLEIRYRGRGALYSYDAEDAGRRGGKGAAVALPFSANGTVAVARDEAEPDSGGAAFFILQKESEVTPAGANILDGRFAAFGYVVDDVDVLNLIQPEDQVVSVKVTDGLQWLKNSRYGK